MAKNVYPYMGIGHAHCTPELTYNFAKYQYFNEPNTYKSLWNLTLSSLKKYKI